MQQNRPLSEGLARLSNRLFASEALQLKPNLYVSDLLEKNNNNLFNLTWGKLDRVFSGDSYPHPSTFLGVRFMYIL